MSGPWTVDEVRTIAELAYFPVLRADLPGERPNKAHALRQAEQHLPGRTHHTLKDRCYRISEVLRDEVLRDEGLPWVQGWKPPDLVGQRPSSAGMTDVIRAAVPAPARSEFA